MNDVPHYVYLFRRRFRVDGPQAPKMTTDVIVVRSLVPLLEHQAVQRLRRLATRPTCEYEMVGVVPDGDVRFDTWDDHVESCADASQFFPVSVVCLDGAYGQQIEASIEFEAMGRDIPV